MNEKPTQKSRGSERIFLPMKSSQNVTDMFPYGTVSARYFQSRDLSLRLDRRWTTQLHWLQVELTGSETNHGSSELFLPGYSWDETAHGCGKVGFTRLAGLVSLSINISDEEKRAFACIDDLQ
jgi:hypothetical protein